MSQRVVRFGGAGPASCLAPGIAWHGSVLFRVVTLVLGSVVLLMSLPFGHLEPIPSSQTSTPVSADPHADRSTYAGCEGFGTRACDVREVGCQEQLFGLMTCLYGASAAVRPSVRWVSEREVAQTLERRSAEVAPRRALLRWAGKWLGLHRSPPSTARAGAPVVPNAYYRPEGREVLLVERSSIPPDSALANFVLGHEFVHAIQDRAGALLRARRSEADRSFDQELALRAAVEGEATFYEEVLRSLHYKRSPLDWVEPQLAQRAEHDARVSPEQPSLVDAALQHFPYETGAFYAAKQWRDSGRRALSLGADHAPSTREILGRTRGWPEAARAACPAGGELESPAGGRRIAADSLGAWLIQNAIQKQTGDPVLAEALARDSTGDRLVAFRQESDATTTFTWKSCWVSGARAADAERQLLEILEHTGRSYGLSRSGATLTLTGSEESDATRAESDSDAVLAFLNH